MMDLFIFKYNYKNKTACLSFFQKMNSFFKNANLIFRLM